MLLCIFLVWLNWPVTEATLTAAFLDLAFVTPENSHDNIVALLPDVSPSRHLYPPPTIARSLRLRFSCKCCFSQSPARSRTPPYSSVHVDTGRFSPSPPQAFTVKSRPSTLPTAHLPGRHPSFLFSLSRVLEPSSSIIARQGPLAPDHIHLTIIPTDVLFREVPPFLDPFRLPPPWVSPSRDCSIRYGGRRRCEF